MSLHLLQHPQVTSCVSHFPLDWAIPKDPGPLHPDSTWLSQDWFAYFRLTAYCA